MENINMLSASRFNGTSANVLIIAETPFYTTYTATEANLKVLVQGFCVVNKQQKRLHEGGQGWGQVG